MLQPKHPTRPQLPNLFKIIYTNTFKLFTYNVVLFTKTGYICKNYNHVLMENSKLILVTCFLDKTSEALKELDSLFTQEDGKLVIKSVEDYLALIRLAYTTLTSSIEDCTGNKIELSLGDSIAANLLESLIKGLLNEKP